MMPFRFSILRILYFARYPYIPMAMVHLQFLQLLYQSRSQIWGKEKDRLPHPESPFIQEARISVGPFCSSQDLGLGPTIDESVNDGSSGPVFPCDIKGDDLCFVHGVIVHSLRFSSHVCACWAVFGNTCNQLGERERAQTICPFVSAIRLTKNLEADVRFFGNTSNQKPGS